MQAGTFSKHEAEGVVTVAGGQKVRTGSWQPRRDSKTETFVLKALAQSGEKFLSGQAIADASGVSRNAVWKAIESLRQQGYEIEARPRRGYRLLARPDLPLPTEVLPSLGATLGDNPFIIEHLPKIGSTNDEARNLAEKGAPQGLVVVAEEQTAGRGRRGRSWNSPPGLGLWASVIMRPPLLPQQVLPIGLLVVAAARAAVEGVTGLPAAIKWPNDLLVNDLKVAGVLLEIAAEAEEVHHIIAGLGLNVNQTEQDFSPQLRGTAGSLRLALGRPLSRVPLLREFLRMLSQRYNHALNHGFTQVLSEVESHCLTIGSPVKVFGGLPSAMLAADGAWAGRAVGLAPDGGLLVRTEESEVLQTVHAGDVTIRHRD